jgi:hypothetical protein
LLPCSRKLRNLLGRKTGDRLFLSFFLQHADMAPWVAERFPERVPELAIRHV